jgi:hypothetical protein
MLRMSGRGTKGKFLSDTSPMSQIYVLSTQKYVFSEDTHQIAGGFK